MGSFDGASAETVEFTRQRRTTEIAGRRSTISHFQNARAATPVDLLVMTHVRLVNHKPPQLSRSPSEVCDAP